MSFSWNQLHKDIEARDEQISKLQSENEELQELAQHVQYMADMIEVCTLALHFWDCVEETSSVNYAEHQGTLAEVCSLSATS